MGWGASPCPQTSTVTDQHQNYNIIESNLLSAASSPTSASATTIPSLATTWFEHQSKAAVASSAQHLLTQFPSPSIPPSIHHQHSLHHEKKSYTPCRYQQEKLDFFSGFGANILPSETVASRSFTSPYNNTPSVAPTTPSTASSVAAGLHESGNSVSSLHQSSHFTPGSYHIQGIPPNPIIHDTTGRSCALPSPTIYPPTPPPSAPWIHPWFVGDTF